MNIPRYWSKATAEAPDHRGKRVAFTCWRSSDASADGAYASALAAANQALESNLIGRRIEHYWYARGPIREEVIERFVDSRGDLFAAVTRNRYGTLVLNSAGVMFFDWDAPHSRERGFIATIKKLFGRKTLAADDRHQVAIRLRIDQFRLDKGDWSIRLYQTAGGLRGLVSHALFDPAAQATLAILRRLESDPIYIRLCESQASFRARLTPKPWRCGAGHCAIAWPREGSAIANFENWLARYEARRSDFATCRFLDVIGSGAVHPEVAPIIKLHDTMTRSSEPLPLA
jgi:hypothetical protein